MKISKRRNWKTRKSGGAPHNHQLWVPGHDRGKAPSRSAAKTSFFFNLLERTTMGVLDGLFGSDGGGDAGEAGDILGGGASTEPAPGGEPNTGTLESVTAVAAACGSESPPRAGPTRRHFGRGPGTYRWFLVSASSTGARYARIRFLSTAVSEAKLVQHRKYTATPRKGKYGGRERPALKLLSRLFGGSKTRAT